MGMLDHWQPVALARDVRAKPVGVTVCGEPIVVFRTASGPVAALANACPHRRLKLSVGTVVGDRLRCKYHGWTYDACGHGESPGTPKLTACATSYEACERYGLVWVKTRDSSPAFPELDPPGFVSIGPLKYEVPAPLELTVDNFNEIEHSGTVHATFGYDLARMHEVQVRYETTDATVRVVNAGPTKRINRLYAFLMGIRKGDLFHDDWTTFFSPMYSIFDHWWTSPDGSRERLIRWRVYVFYVPQDDKTTRVFAVSYVKSRYPLPGGGIPLVRWLFRWETDKEIQADVSMLDHMASYSPDVEGMKLSRFDKVLGLTRDRIHRIYRGLPARVSLV